MVAPSNVSFGTAVGRFGRFVADSNDPDRDPDFIPNSNLSLQFSPSARIFKNVSASPVPITLGVEPISASTDDEGYVVDSEGARGVRLVATDDADLSPTGWTWRVSITGTGLSISFSFLLPSDGEVDLTTLVPVPSNPGEGLEDWEIAVNTAQDAVLNAEAYAQQARLAADQAQATAGVLVAPEPTGDDQTADLQSSLNTATSLGFRWAYDGDYVIESALTVPSGASIDGSRGTIRQTGNRQAGFFIPTGNSNVRIENVTAYGLTTDYANDSGIHAAAAVYVQNGATNVDVVGCTFEGWAGVGVRIRGEHVRVLNCRIVGPGAEYITDDTHNFAGGVILGTGSNDVTVRGTDISEYAQGINTGKSSGLNLSGNRVHHIRGQHGLYLGQIDNAVISGNLIHDCELLGMKVQLASSADADASDITISNNVFRDVGTQGILLTNIEDNALRVRDVSVTGNVITRAGLTAIEAIRCSGITISGNTARSTQSLLRVSLSDHVHAIGNDGYDSSRSGIGIAGSDGVIVESNTVDGVASEGNTGDRFGIWISGGNTDLTVKGNRVRDDGGLMPWGVNLSSWVGAETHDYIDNDIAGAFQYGWRGPSSPVEVRSFRGNRLVGDVAPALNPPTNLAQVTVSGRTVSAYEYGVRPGSTQDQSAALHAAFAAAEEAGGGASIELPRGEVRIDGSFKLAGYSSALVGGGAGSGGSTNLATGSFLKAYNQTGPVLDFTDYKYPLGQRGRVTFSDFTVVGDGVVDPDNKGIFLGTGGSSSSIDLRAITILNTGGVGLHVKDHYLSDFYSVTVCNPVDAAVNDTPYVLLEGANGNRYYGLGLRSLNFNSAVADTPASGALRLIGGLNFQHHLSVFYGLWAENMHLGDGGTAIVTQSNRVTFNDTQFFDCYRVEGTTGTAYYRIEAPSQQNYGGNTISGYIPGQSGGESNAIELGIDLQQSATRIVGTKGHGGNNVRIAPGVEYVWAELGGANHAGNNSAFDDQSGSRTNTLIDGPQGNWVIGGRSGASLSISGSYQGDLARDTATVTDTWNFNVNFGHNIFPIVLAGATTMSSPPVTAGTPAGRKITLILEQDETGGRTVSWPSNLRFAGGSAPTLSTDPGAIDTFSFVYLGGLSWAETSRAIGC